MNPTRQTRTLAVDVGNTAIKLAVRKSETLLHTSIPIHTDHWPEAVIDWAGRAAETAEIRWIISSVQRRATRTLIDRIDAAQPTAHWDGKIGRQSDRVHVVGHHDIPMVSKVDQPDSLGIDRLLGAFAATQMTPVSARASGLVIIDAGSAITVDHVDGDGYFSGGAILPGLRLQARSLATGTDALPQIDWSSDQAVRLPGRNTSAAIFGGILVGVAGAIDRLVGHYQSSTASENFGEQPQRSASKNLLQHDASQLGHGEVVLTGGDAMAISKHLTCKHRIVENLVCRGLLALVKRRREATCR